jgi:hypothetical protein
VIHDYGGVRKRALEHGVIHDYGGVRKRALEHGVIHDCQPNSSKL